MAEKAVPEFMKRYMENIGEDSFKDYDLLSQEYHKSVEVYHGMKFPSRIMPRGGPPFKQDIQADLYRLGEQFKSRALDIACKKHGYKDPAYQNYDKSLTEIQEGNLSGGISKGDFGLTAEDMRARKAHAIFEKETPDKMAYKEGNRAVIDYYYSGPDGPAQRDENRSKSLSQKEQDKTAEKEPNRTAEKEPRSIEENKALAKDFIASGEDISKSKNRFSMSDRFFMSLSSSQQALESNKRSPAKGRNNMEMERDI